MKHLYRLELVGSWLCEGVLFIYIRFKCLYMTNLILKFEHWLKLSDKMVKLRIEHHGNRWYNESAYK